MRVCMLLRNLFVRDARVLREARALAGAGHDVTVLALRAGALPDVEERDGFRVVRVPAGRLAGPTILGAGSPPSGRGRRSFRPSAAVRLRDASLSRRLRAAALEIPADVYHAHDLNTLAPALAAARAQGAAVVYDAHELYPELTGLAAPERARWARLERRLIARADAVIVPSASRGEELSRRYGIAPPLVVMNCPPARASRRPDASPLTPLRRPGEALVVYAGGFTPNRGLENLVRSIALVPGARLAMVGWGPLEASLRSLAGDGVTFIGSVEPDEVVGAIAAADIGVAAYLPVGLNNVLAAPNKLFEYLHAGLAVAGSDLPDIRRVVEQHRVGALFDAGDAGSIAKALAGMASDPKELAAMRRRAAGAAALYTWEEQAARLVDLYGRLPSVRPI